MKLQFGRVLRLFHTLKYLLLSQMFWRIVRRFQRVDTKALMVSPIRESHGSWVVFELIEKRMISEWGFIFLNLSGMVNGKDKWAPAGRSTLWLYNLHYFDDLIAEQAGDRSAWHRCLISDWIRQNPVRVGIAWDPYPSSIRIVNWIKWALNGASLKPEYAVSLCLQTHVLTQTLERHLLGNHLFSNAKAMVFAGLYFDGEASQEWLQKGLKILDRQMDEQVLEDGGNFELSTMYHSVMLYDVLDLLNICEWSQNPLMLERKALWTATAGKMLAWLKAMIHPDGGISFFNDAAFNISPDYRKLKEYADTLNVQEHIHENVKCSNGFTVSHFESSGYVRVCHSNYVAILDCANIGPDYLPGHGHADALSFELSVGGQRIFVNSGTSCYGEGKQRLLERSTCLHNTVEVDGQNSSEVWGGFRVARRAYTKSANISMNDNISIESSHDGYKRLPGKVVHMRRWDFDPDRIQVLDKLSGKYCIATAYFYLHPLIKVTKEGPIVYLHCPDDKKIRVSVSGGTLSVKCSEWHPEFGKSIRSSCLSIKFEQSEIKTTMNIE